MRVESINVGMPREIEWKGNRLRTGIFKEPAREPVPLTVRGFEGDGQADHRHHGRPHQAVCAYPADYYPLWRKELGREELHYGTFGENLTISGCDEKTVHIGDILRARQAALQVTWFRTPCHKLGMRLGDESFPARLRETIRLGFYLRVLEEGLIQSGDDVTLMEADFRAISVHALSVAYLVKPYDLSLLRAALDIESLAGPVRENIEQRLAG
jgi:MOSC domain-containing protein YiiM